MPRRLMKLPVPAMVMTQVLLMALLVSSTMVERPFMVTPPRLRVLAPRA